MTFTVGRRLPGMVIAAVVVYAAAANSLVVWLYMVFAMLLAMLPIGIAGPLIASRTTALRFSGASSSGFVPPLSQDRGRVFAGDRMTIRLNGEVDTERCSLGPIRCADGTLLDVSVHPTAGGALLVELDVPRRGSIRCEAIRYRCTWPLGLAVVDRWLPLNTELVVHPRYTVPALGRSGGDLSGEEEIQKRGHGETFVGVREYRSGDARRHVHWLATARMGKLMVIETASPAATPVRFAVQLHAGCDDANADHAIYIAASLIAACVAEGRPFRLGGVLSRSSLRRWSEALPALAMARPSEGTLGGPSAAGSDVVTISADTTGVTITRASGDPVHVGPSADEQELAHVLDQLR